MLRTPLPPIGSPQGMRASESRSRLAQLAVVSPAQRASGPLYTTSPSHLLVAPTAQPAPKIFDEGMYFGKGDAGTHMFGRGFAQQLRVTPKLDGEGWTGGAHKPNHVPGFSEAGTSVHNSLRVFRAPGNPHMQYQTNCAQWPKSRYWGN